MKTVLNVQILISALPYISGSLHRPAEHSASHNLKQEIHRSVTSNLLLLSVQTIKDKTILLDQHRIHQTVSHKHLTL